MIDGLLFVAGLALVVLGAEGVVRGAARVAGALGISPMVIGLTIVSIGTSAPELAVGIVSARQGIGGLAVGNIAGTNLVNLLLILGLSALLRPLPLKLQIFKLELPVIVAAAIVMTLLAWDGLLSGRDGMLMLLAGLAYSAALFEYTRRASRSAKREYREEYAAPPVAAATAGRAGHAAYALLLVGGIALTVVGAEVLVRGASGIARSAGASETIIGLTIVAIGTSAPELVTTIVATLRDDRDVAVGNLLGSSIYNILVVLAIICMTAPAGLEVVRPVILFDIPIMAAVAVGAIPIFISGRQVSRWEGGAGVVCYVAYLAWLVIFRR